MATEAQRRAVKKYDAANTVQFHLKLNVKTDAAIIEKLKTVENVQGYLKDLVRADIERANVGRWIPARVQYVESKHAGYMTPKYIADESLGYSSIYICSLCGDMVESKYADDWCSNCHHKMTPFSPEKL